MAVCCVICTDEVTGCSVVIKDVPTEWRVNLLNAACVTFLSLFVLCAI